MASNLPLLQINKIWFSGTTVIEGDWDNIRIPLVNWANYVNLAFQQVTLDAFGTGYQITNTGAPFIAVSLQDQINNIISGTTPLRNIILTDGGYLKAYGDAFNTVLNYYLDGSTGNVTLYNGGGFSIYSDEGTTLKAVIAGTGNAILQNIKIENGGQTQFYSDGGTTLQAFISGVNGSAQFGATTLTAALNMNTHQINGLAMAGSPAGTDATNVTYVNAFFPVTIANGGTGQITANAAFNALAPSQTGESGKYLTTNGSNTSWAPVTTGTVTSITAGTGITCSPDPITSTGTISLVNAGPFLEISGGTLSGELGINYNAGSGPSLLIVNTDATHAASINFLNTSGTDWFIGAAGGSTDRFFFQANGGGQAIYLLSTGEILPQIVSTPTANALSSTSGVKAFIYGTFDGTTVTVVSAWNCTFGSYSGGGSNPLVINFITPMGSSNYAILPCNMNGGSKTVAGVTAQSTTSFTLSFDLGTGPSSFVLAVFGDQ